MPNRIPKCPICGRELIVKKLECPNCNITIEGDFWLNKLASLDPEELEFLELFLKTRGNVKEMERILKISYPTVRSKLDNILKNLGLLTEEEEEPKSKAEWIIDQLEKGELSVQDALKILEEDENAQ
ncbi:MAG TPA: DUF2089 domain-containing protein [Dictyoglomaceae bacterium]|nr:DUF2089 domain-containing protein [Dictyoglomaceae bacterium]HOL39019.1 DUF2089 domain-containing protein [Dictyoglomaceae bacterium]HOP94358.1 DUF2089 domain-containing protein [Dictyoglomaceae bacterium]HPP15805.1 DUF2089 domain-containing protein [Dictyoglomaceae bacterium]HPU42794.1 DUF2089 domain-containing protein [Dictyoglomaceae bacterium]